MVNYCIMRYNIYKLLILVTCCYILFLTYKQPSFTFKTLFPDNDITYYTKLKLEDGQNFNCAGLYANVDIVGTNIKGESMEVGYEELYVCLSKLKANIFRCEYIHDLNLTMLYGYSPLIEKTLNGINLQIAVYTDHAIIGWPMIYGSF